MKRASMCQRVLRRAGFALITGGLMFQVASGCDSQVRTTVLSGFQNLATTFVDAFFLVLATGTSSSTPTGTTPTTGT
jgi:hypothetical protein